MAVNLATQTDFSDSGAHGPAAAATLPPSPEEIARHFPNFEILECLGRGGMGVVYRARQKSLNRLVALKILAPERVKDDAFAKRFVIEAETLAKLSHPNIVTIHDFGQADGLFYLVMEFVDGVTLRQLLGASRLSAREALAIVPQICDALQYAHDAGIVHRDIKPENILLDRRGRVKVADFGLAKLVGTETSLGVPALAGSGEPAADRLKPGLPTLTGAQIMGTPRYMSPEQAGQPGEVDHRADIFSLGVVLYEMLTGELPGKELQRPSRKVLVDVRLDEVVLRALEQKPELRYQQASEVKTRLETIASTPPGGSGFASAQTESKRHEGAGSRPTSATRFHWNFWGHFGAASGASLWMPVTAISSEWSGLGIALSAVAALVIMVTAFVVWGLRHRLSAFRGLMILLAASFVATTVFLAGADALGLTVRSSWPGGTQVSPSRYAWVLAIFPLLAVWFLGLERDATAGSPRSPDPNLDGETPPRRWLTVGMASVVLTYAVGLLSWMLLSVLQISGSSLWILALFILTAVGSPLLSSVLLRHADPSVPRRFRKTCGIVAGFIAMPLIGFALFFLFALLSETGGWNPAPDEAVIVPLVWLGAVLLPVCSWRLWREANPPVLGVAEANPLPIMDFWQALEAGDYPRAWEKTALYFQRDLPEDRWVSRMEEFRRPLGKAVSRQTLSQVFTNSGRRFEQVVRTTFDTQQSATETIVGALQADGEWRVEKYELGRPGPCESQASQPPAAGTGRDVRTKSGIFGIPWVHVASGTDPATGRPRVAKGIVAVGPTAIGVVAVGLRAFGVMPVGLVAIGAMPVGLVALGGLATGLLGVGLMTSALMSFAWLQAVGLLALSANRAVGLIALAPTATGLLPVSLGAVLGVVICAIASAAIVLTTVFSPGFRSAALNWRLALTAAIWHVGLLVLALALTVGAVSHIMPIYEELLQGMPIPPATRFVLHLGGSLRSHALWLALLLPGFLVVEVGLCLLAQNLGGRRGQRLWSLAWVLGWLLAIGMGGLALTIPLRLLASGPAAPPPLNKGQSIGFASAVEVTLPLSDLGYSYSLNLDSGEMQPMPAGMTMADWSTGIQLPDGIIVIAPATNRALTVGGTGTRVIPLLNSAAVWDNPQPAQLESLDGLASGQTESVTGESSSPPVTFAFRTAKGVRGLLQITGFTENPRGLDLRYKLARSLPASPGKSQPIAATRWQDYLRLKQGIGLGESGTGSHGDDALRYAIQYNRETVALTLAWRTEPGWEYRVQAKGRFGGLVDWTDKAATRTASGSGTNRIVEERLMLSRREFERIAALVLQKKHVPPQTASVAFGPVTERAVSPKDVDAQGLLFLDLERNRTFQPPMPVRFAELTGLEMNPALADWLRTNRIDLLVCLVPQTKVAGSTNTIPGAHLRGVNLSGAVVLDEAVWNEAASDPSAKPWQTLDPELTVSDSRLLGQGARPYHALLRTRDGSLFALEARSNGKPADAVKLRFKQAANGKPAAALKPIPTEVFERWAATQAWFRDAEKQLKPNDPAAYEALDREHQARTLAIKELIRGTVLEPLSQQQEAAVERFRTATAAHDAAAAQAAADDVNRLRIEIEDLLRSPAQPVPSSPAR
jgi:serine/threonine protein kinase